MSLKRKVLITLMTLSCCLTAGNGYGKEIEEKDVPLCAEIGSRESQFRNKKIEKSDFENVEEIEAAEEKKEEASSNSDQEAKTVEFGAFYYIDDVIYKAAHYLYATSSSGALVQIDDGSIWRVASSDTYKTRYWEHGDLIVLAENDAWFPSTRFKLINYTLRQSVQVEISKGPRMDWNPRWVYSIDYNNLLVWLDDGTCWDISGSVRQFDDWRAGNVMIIGINEGWGSSSFPFIIYNVTMNDYMIADSLN